MNINTKFKYPLIQYRQQSKTRDLQAHFNVGFLTSSVFLRGAQLRGSLYSSVFDENGVIEMKEMMILFTQVK